MAALPTPVPGREGRRGRVLVIYTGGTLGMVTSPSGLRPAGRDALGEQLREMPWIDEVPPYDLVAFDPVIDSSNVSPANWAMLVQIIDRYYLDYNGFVVIHGTDTMAYTASALSFMLENLGKLVVITGSMLPLTDPYTDAKSNLVLSMLFAGYFDIPEVCIMFGNKLIRGCRATKTDAESLSAFDSPNFPLLSRVGVQVELYRHLVRDPPKLRLTVRPALDAQVIVLHLVPGFSDAIFKAIRGQIDGVVLMLYGTGNGPSSKLEFIETVRALIQGGTTVVAISQCSKGRVQLGMYEVGTALADVGVLSGGDMTTEAASTKLSWLLGQGLRGDELADRFEANLRGEITDDGGFRDGFAPVIIDPRSIRTPPAPSPSNRYNRPRL